MANSKILSPRDSLNALQELGLGKQLTETLAEEIGWDLDDPQAGETSVIDMMCDYYRDQENGNERCLKDGFLTHDWRFGQETSDVVAELSALVGEPALLTQLGYKDINKHIILGVQQADGTGLSIEVDSLDDVVALFNYVLRQKGDTRRFFTFRTGGDYSAHFLLDIAIAERLSKENILPFENLKENVNPTISPETFDFGTWLPEHLKNFKCAGKKLISGKYLINDSGGSATIYDISVWPPEPVLGAEFDWVSSFSRSEAGLWHFIGRSETFGVKGSRLILLRPGQPFKNRILIDAENAVDSSSAGYFIGETLLLFSNAARVPVAPRIEDGGALKFISGIKPVKSEGRNACGSVATLANGKTVLLWDDVFYYFEKNACTEFLDLKEETVREMLVPIGKDGFICLVKAKPHLIVPGKDPVKLIDENFYELTPGPRDSVILRRPESWAPGRRDILLFPETGRVIAFNDAIFGSPSTEVQHVCYEPASDKIIGTYWDEILAVPAAQLV